jgi:cytochrome P450
MIAVQLLLSFSFGTLLLYMVGLITEASSFHSFARRHGCASLKTLDAGLLSKIYHKLRFVRESTKDLLDDYYANKFLKYGPTHAIVNAWWVPKVVHTTEPANLHQVLVVSHKDWGVSQRQRNALYPLVQNGVLTTSGAEWSHNRKHVSRHVNGNQSRDPRAGEEDVRMLFSAIGPHGDGEWTESADLSDLIRRMTLDMATRYLFGISAGSQQSGMQRKLEELGAVHEGHVVRPLAVVEEFNDAFDQVRGFIIWRAALGSKYWLADSPKVSLMDH